MRIAAVLALSACALAGAAAADPWKDESGHQRGEYYDRYDDRRYDDGDRYRYGRSDYLPRVPRGHLPPRGSCRVWYEDRPPGHQPPPMSCARAERLADRAGAFVVTSGGRIYGTYHDRYDRYDRDDRHDRYDRW